MQSVLEVPRKSAERNIQSVLEVARQKSKAQSVTLRAC